MGIGLRAGAASGVITPSGHLPMAGYARRDGPAEGTLDDLMCRAVVLDDGADRLVLAVVDLLYATRPLTALVRARVEYQFGIPADHVMLAATHTHAGPGGLAMAGTPLLQLLSDRIVDVITQAGAGLVPARILLGDTTVDDVSLNRRDPDGARDSRARVLRLVECAGGAPIATLVNYACHATILEHDNRAWSADFPGAACRTMETVAGGTALYLQGCAGNINPVYTGHQPADCRRVGAIVGTAAARTALELDALPGGLRSINLSWDEEVRIVPRAAGRIVPPAALRAMRALVEPTPRSRPSRELIANDLAVVRAALDRAARPDQRRSHAARGNELWAEALFAADDQVFDSMDLPGREPGPIEVQAFRIGRDLVLVALPGEPFAETGFEIRADQAADVLIAGYANVSAGYLPTEAEFGRSGYEVGCSLYARGTAELLTLTARRLVEALTSNGGAGS